MQKIIRHLHTLFDTITDWLLIVIGIILIVKSAVAIDVPVARYSVMGVGGVLTAVGFWYRYRRKKRHR